MILMSKYKGQHGGKKGKKNSGRGLPPPLFGQCPKKNIFFFVRASLRLSHPVFLAPKEKHWAGDLLKFVLRGLFAPVHSKILLGCGEVVGSKLLCVHSLAKVVDVARAGSRWLMGNNFL